MIEQPETADHGEEGATAMADGRGEKPAPGMTPAMRDDSIGIKR